MSRRDWRTRDDKSIAEHSRSKSAPSKTRKSKSNRFEVLNGFYDRVADRVQPIDAMVFGYMFRHADRSNVVQVSHGQIAKTIGKHRSTVIRSIGRLEELGILKCIWRSGLGHVESNRYRLSVPPHEDSS